MTPAPPSSSVVAASVVVGLALAALGVATGGLGGALVLLGLGLAVVGLLALVSGRRMLVVTGRGRGALALAVAGGLVIAGGALLPDDDGARRVAQEVPSTGAPVPSTATVPATAAPDPSTTPDVPTTPDPTRPATDPTDPATGRAPSALPPQAAPPTAGPESASPAGALATVAELEVKGRAPRTGYDRDAFAYREYDQDRNGCDVRNDILRRDLVDIVIGPGTNGCVVERGTLHDPYSGRAIDFVRGAGTSNAVQIDHVVSLSDAWQKGAQAWDEATRREFGNDPLNLLAVDGPLNAQKGDGDTATWLPPNRGYRCAFVARQVAVKSEYELWVTQAEHDAMVRVLSTCPAEPLPERETVALMPELAEAA